MGVHLPVTEQSQAWTKAIQIAFVAGDLDLALRIVHDATAQLGPVGALDDVVAPGLRRVGELWESGIVTVADEHLATATALRLLAVTIPGLRSASPSSRGELAILATPGPEQHHTTLLMVEAVLHGGGYEVKNLGAGVPGDALAELVAREQPAIVGISATMPWGPVLGDTVQAVHLAAPAARILVGGRGVPEGGFGASPAEPIANLRALAAALGL